MGASSMSGQWFQGAEDQGAGESHRSAAFSGCQRGVQGDFGVQQLGHGTTGLRLGGELFELCLVRAWDFSSERQMNRSDGEAVRDLVQRDLSLGFPVLIRQPSLAENE